MLLLLKDISEGDEIGSKQSQIYPRSENIEKDNYHGKEPQFAIIHSKMASNSCRTDWYVVPIRFHLYALHKHEKDFVLFLSFCSNLYPSVLLGIIWIILRLRVLHRKSREKIENCSYTFFPISFHKTAKRNLRCTFFFAQNRKKKFIFFFFFSSNFGIVFVRMFNWVVINRPPQSWPCSLLSSASSNDKLYLWPHWCTGTSPIMDCVSISAWRRHCWTYSLFPLGQAWTEMDPDLFMCTHAGWIQHAYT